MLPFGWGNYTSVFFFPYAGMGSAYPDPGLQPPPANAPSGTRKCKVSCKQLQKKRFEDMKRDSQKLLELATELKQYVDKSGENILSLEVVTEGR